MSKCEHGRQKCRCNQCGGASFCEHSRRKQDCIECGGSSYCIHEKRKALCIECGGSSYCIHGKQKIFCRDCNGSSICEHGKQKCRCKQCGGASFCEHSRRREQCIDCNGSSYCIHKKRKIYCKQCGGGRLCKTPLCETISTPKYKGHCLACFIHLFPDQPNARNYKTKEQDVVHRIMQTFRDFTWIADKRVQDGCSRRRPDLLLDMGSHIIIVEIDENKHSGYDCENKRIMLLSQDLQHRPIVFIRFNPDSYTNQDGVFVKSCWKLNKLGVMQIGEKKQQEWAERIEKLKQQIQYWIDNISQKTIEIIELFY